MLVAQGPLVAVDKPREWSLGKMDWWFDRPLRARRLLADNGPAEMLERAEDVRTWVRGVLA